jgi:hypothetical protein
MTTALDKLVDGMQRDPDAHTLLVGAGCSQSAGIDDGESLLARLADGRPRDPKQSLVQWYVAQYGRWPSYEAILVQQAGHVVDASAPPATALAPLFKPTPAERTAGVKVPRPAHHALAGLARAGCLRLILTTNFDRLIESALLTAGIPIRVLATPDEMALALPLAAHAVTVVKLHGDWMAIRPKVLSREPRTYADQHLNDLLRRVFADHHVIVCGWSGEWDIALRAALADGPLHRSLYWAAVREPGPAATAVLAARRGLLIRIPSADEFLPELATRALSAAHRAPGA